MAIAAALLAITAPAAHATNEPPANSPFGVVVNTNNRDADLPAALVGTLLGSSGLTGASS